jgi:hypothetical protein
MGERHRFDRECIFRSGSTQLSRERIDLRSNGAQACFNDERCAAANASLKEVGLIFLPLGRYHFPAHHCGAVQQTAEETPA